jgi:protoporphyrinogen/coproporphyrinogen III oxidase
MKIGVVGAGMSGLTAAHRLQQAGHRVEVFEREAAPGGRMCTVEVDGHRIDPGTQMLLDSFTRTRALVRELGLDAEWFDVPSGEGGGVLHDHALSSFSPTSALDVLRFRGVSLRGRVRLLRAFVEAHRQHPTLDFFDLSLGDDGLDAEDCDSFARRKLGDEVADYVVDCFIRTFHFHGARRMSLKYFEALSSLFIEHAEEFTSAALHAHMQVLPSALAAGLSVRYGARALSVRTSGHGVTLQLNDQRHTFDALVLAMPAECARELLAEPTPPQRALLEPAQSSCTVFLAFEVPSALAGYFEGVWVPYVESALISGFANDLVRGELPREHCVFSVWLHEEAAGALAGDSDDALFGVVAAELARLFPKYRGALRPLHLRRWPHALPVYGPGQVSRVRAFWEHGQGEGGIWLCGDYLNHPWVEGAVRCGEKVARLIDLGSGAP